MKKETLIKKEYEKLKNIFAEAPENKKTLLETAINNCAFMGVALRELKEEINKNGYVERYQNGENQFGIKDSSYVRAYNNMIKNYNASLKILLDNLVSDTGAINDLKKFLED